MMEKTTFLSRVVPGSLIGRVVLFFFLPTFFLLVTLWAVLYQPSPLAPYLAGLLLFGSVMSCKYRTKGLFISLAALVAVYFFKHSGFSFYEIGLCFAAATDFFILLLSVDEVKASLSVLVNESKSHINQYLSKNQELLEGEQNWTKAKQTLEEEITKWKEEAEQRKVDLIATHEKMQLIQSEIEMLTAQKESILHDSYTVRREAKEQLALLKDQMAEVERARTEVHKRLESTTDIDALKRENETHLARIGSVEGEFRVRLESQEREYEKLLTESQACVNDQQGVALKEEYEQRLAVQEKEFAERLAKIQVDDQQGVALKEEYEQRLAVQEKEFAERLAKIQVDDQQGVALKEECEQRLAVQEKDFAERLTQIPEKTQEQAQLEGLYKQLRNQFEEKSRALVKTRKELFSKETQLKVIELDQKLQVLSGDREEAEKLEKALAIAVRECEVLEDEVSSLEALISHVLAQ